MHDFSKKESKPCCSHAWASWRGIRGCPPSRPSSQVGGRVSAKEGVGARALEKPVSLRCQISHPRTSQGHLLLPSPCLGTVSSCGVHTAGLRFKGHAFIQTQMRKVQPAYPICGVMRTNFYSRLKCFFFNFLKSELISRKYELNGA